MIEENFLNQNVIAAISILANIGTFISALLAYNTLREMKAQRKDSNKPELILFKTDFYVFIDYTKEKQEKFYWSHKYLTKLPDIFFNDISMNCINIGMETAKFVKVEWDINTEKLVKAILKYDTKQEFKIYYDELMCQINNRVEGTLIYNVVEYILPIKLKNRPYKIKLPNIYIHLISIAYYLCWQQTINHEEVTEEAKELMELLHGLPFIKLKLQYKDILNNEYKQIYDIQMINSRISFLPEGYEEENMFAYVRLEIRDLSNVFKYKRKRIFKVVELLINQKLRR